MQEHSLVNDKHRTIVALLNDYDVEYDEAIDNLAKLLKRKLRGVILLDKNTKQNKRNVPDPTGKFEVIECDFSNEASLRRTLKNIEENLLLLTCSGDYNQPFLQKVIPHIPYLLSPTESSIDWSTHKGQMRAMLRSFDEDLVPRVYEVTKYSAQEIQKITQRLDFPLIVKPTGLAASMLVSRVNNIEELREVLKYGFKIIEDIYKQHRGRGAPGFIIEEFIAGQLYSTDVYVSSEGQVWQLPLFRVDTAHSLGKEGFYTYHTDSSHNLSKEDVKASQLIVNKAVHALGLRSCVAHVELFHTKSGWKVVELGPRAGGDRQDMYYLGYGVDHAYNEFLIKIGLEPHISNMLLSHVAKEHIIPDEEGILNSIEGIAEAEKIDSVFRIKQKARPGEKIVSSHKGGKVIVGAVLSNKKLETLLDDADTLRKTIRFDINKGSK